MLSIIEYKEKMIAEPELQKDIQGLITYTTTEKKFKYISEELPFDPSRLINNLILTKSGNQIEISDSYLFHFEFFHHYSSKLSFELNTKVDEIFQFINKIEEEIETDQPFNQSFNSYIRKFTRFLLFQIHTQKNVDFNTFILSLNKESGQIIYDFNDAYSDIIPNLIIPHHIFFQNIKHLMETLKSDATFDGNTGALRNAIREYCKSNIESGKALLQYSLTNQTPVIHNLNIPMIGGIYEIKRSEFWSDIVQLYSSEENEVSVICALASVPSINNQEAKEYYELITSVSDPKLDSLLNLPKFYCAIVNNKNISDVNLKKLCLSRLSELIVNPHQNVRGYTLLEVGFIEGYDIETVELLKQLISTNDFDRNQIKSVADVFRRHKHLPSFIDFLNAYAAKFKLQFEGDPFYSPIYHFYQKDSENFSKELIKLLTNNKGEIRYIGNKIIDLIELHSNRFKFETDLLQFDEMIQYKLWMSVLATLKEPKKCIPMLIQLIDSNFPIVQEAFICKLELLAEEYGLAVTEALKSELDLNNLHHVAVIERVETYSDSYYKEIFKRNRIKELDPTYTQAKLLRLFQENYKKSFNKKTKEEVNKNSLFSQIATTVILAKGGGWKHETHKKVSKLSKIGISFQLPRSMFITPELVDWEFRTHYLKNWEDKFKEWEAIKSL